MSYHLHWLVARLGRDDNARKITDDTAIATGLSGSTVTSNQRDVAAEEVQSGQWTAVHHAAATATGTRNRTTPVPCRVAEETGVETLEREIVKPLEIDDIAPSAACFDSIATVAGKQYLIGILGVVESVEAIADN